MGAPPLHDSTPAPKDVRLTRARVLVVDDELMILRIVSRILSPTYQVIVTTSAREALALVKSGERFDLILSDLMLPEMTGMDLYRELVASAPEVAACMVFLTGGALTPQTREFLDTVPNRCLEKPFDARELELVVRERLS